MTSFNLMRRSPTFRRFVSILAVAAAYWAAGKAGLSLAIPPGFATAVWPASGIALAAVLLSGAGCWPGVLLGSFLVNIGNSLDATSGEALARSLFIALGIASGASVQAVLGGRLVRRFAGAGDLLSREGSIFRLLLLGGPVGSLFNATWGVGLLALMGVLPSDILLSNWWTWWVGDAIGVMIFTPLILLWSVRSADGWRRQAVVSGPLVVVFAVVVALFIQSSRSDRGRIQKEFSQQAGETGDALGDDLARDLENLYAMEGFFAGSQRVERDEFGRFTAPLLERHPDLQAISWNERVPAARRRQFEARLRGEGFRGARITERTRGRLVPAGERDEFMPVTYVEPLSRNRNALGYDVASSPSRREAMLRSLKTRRPAATAPVRLIQDDGQRRGILVFLPLFGRAGEPPLGYAVDIFLLKPMLESRLGGVVSRDVSVTLYDESATADRRLLYGVPLQREALAADVPVEMAGRTWRLHMAASPDYLITHSSMEAWNMLAGGLLLAGILGALLLVVTGRTARVEEEVARRTAELRARQAERDELLVELERANRELNDFAHIVSHDLKAPLRGISSLAGWVLEDHGENLGGEGREQLGMLRARVRRMADMIDGILQYSRIGRVSEEKEDVDLGALVAGVVDLLAPPAGISVSVEGSLPRVRGTPVRLQQVFQNLIGNAVKHMDRPEGRVTVSCAEDGGFWRFCVADDGPGIEERHFQKIFQIFQTLAPRDKKESTGVGLAIVKKVVESAAGKVWVESSVGRGARFFFTWPRRPACVEKVAEAVS